MNVRNRKEYVHAGVRPETSVRDVIVSGRGVHFDWSALYSKVYTARVPAAFAAIFTELVEILRHPLLLRVAERRRALGPRRRLRLRVLVRGDILRERRERGASYLEIDGVIGPADMRTWILRGLKSVPPLGPRRPFIDAW